MESRLVPVCWPCALLLSLTSVVAVGADPPSSAPTSTRTYSYATNGIKDDIAGAFGSKWKLLLDESNLGGKELAMVELTMLPGTVVPSHMHGTVEIIYVLSGTYEHEVNGKLYRLTPGMVGLLRPGDHVRHIVPKSGPAKVLIMWAPAGDDVVRLRSAKGTTLGTVAAGDTP